MRWITVFLAVITAAIVAACSGNKNIAESRRVVRDERAPCLDAWRWLGRAYEGLPQ